MNSIPSSISDMLLATASNIFDSDAVTEQKISDTYRWNYSEKGSLLVKREFQLGSKRIGKEVKAWFRFIETYPDRTVTRIDLEDLTSVSSNGEHLAIACEDYVFTFKIKEEE